ncbi:hypothetical protein NIES22_69230 (plasmid) [Calothrix brevissima NIES-22]|nr:hypothetical protein NIES22_69230 [Calothrix brevissima NIES-22]
MLVVLEIQKKLTFLDKVCVTIYLRQILHLNTQIISPNKSEFYRKNDDLPYLYSAIAFI